MEPAARRLSPVEVERGAGALLSGPLSFSALRGWERDDHAAAFRTFLAGARLVAASAPKTRALGVEGAALQEIARRACGCGELHSSEARRFFETHFVPRRIEAAGFVTGYFEPVIAASRTRNLEFSVPLYRRPHDLVEVSDADRPAGWEPEVRFARKTAAGLELYYDRAAIEDGALEGRGLEIAWLQSAVDAFFIHVQGSARLVSADGTVTRIAFDGKSGHRYTSIGRLAVERGLLPIADADKDGLEAWLKSHPEEGRSLMRENRSFIFFREVEVAADDGPIGAAGVPLSAGRSLAVDRTVHTFHTPFWVQALGLDDPDRPEHPFRRLMLAQDTGSAIVGAARGDIFFGSGSRAGSRAGRVRHPAEMVLLVPRSVG